MFFSLGFVWVVFDKMRQGWHDKIADTVVIYADSEFSETDTVDFVQSDQGRGWVWVVIWVIIALTAPAGVLGGLWFMGPIANLF